MAAASGGSRLHFTAVVANRGPFFFCGSLECLSPLRASSRLCVCLFLFFLLSVYDIKQSTLIGTGSVSARVSSDRATPHGPVGDDRSHISLASDQAA